MKNIRIRAAKNFDFMLKKNKWKEKTNATKDISKHETFSQKRFLGYVKTNKKKEIKKNDKQNK